MKESSTIQQALREDSHPITNLRPGRARWSPFTRSNRHVEKSRLLMYNEKKHKFFLKLEDSCVLSLLWGWEAWFGYLVGRVNSSGVVSIGGRGNHSISVFVPNKLGCMM